MPVAPHVIEVFDRRRIRQNRNRAALEFHGHDFLFQWTADHLLDRLTDIKRAFPLALQIGARGLGQGKLDSAQIENLITMDLAESCLPDRLAVQADEEFLPFAQNSFDMIISPPCLHSVNDLPGALIQINRALKPDGLFLAALFGGETLFELREIMMQAEMTIKGGAAPHIAPFADKQQMGALMQRAGFALPVVDSELVTVTYDHVLKLMRDLRFMGEGNALAGQTVQLGKAMLAEIEKLYRARFAEPDGRLKATFEIIFLIGWAPHASQQQPLRPGSAETRLAEALETEETSYKV